MGGFVQIRRIFGTLLKMILKVWAYSGLVLVFCFLLYYFYGGLFAISLLFLSITGVLYHVQDNFLFYPELPSHSRVYIPIPSTFGLPYENIYYRCLDGTKIHLYFIPQPPERLRTAPTMVFFHGNAGNMGHRLQNCRGFYMHLQVNILLVEYRGYGLSEGRPNENGLYMDARAALDYLFDVRGDINHSEIIIFGRSLGGAVAIDLACREMYSARIWCLIVENTFTSIQEMVKVLLAWRVLNYLPRLCYKNKFESVDKMRSLHVPSLFISGMADSLVPPRMMAELHGGCRSAVKQLLQLADGTHNETWTLPGYYHSVSVFLANCRLHKTKEKSEAIQIEEKAGRKWDNVQNI